MNRILALTALVAFATCGLAGDKDDGPRIGKMNRDIEEIPKDLGCWGQAKPFRLKDNLGKVVLMHFWSAGDYACDTNMKHYAIWKKLYEDKGLVVVGMHVPPLTMKADSAEFKALPKQEQERLKLEEKRVDARSLERAKAMDREFPTVFCRDEAYFQKVGGKSNVATANNETSELGVPAFALIDRKGKQRYFVEGILSTRHGEFTKKPEEKIEELLKEKRDR